MKKLVKESIEDVFNSLDGDELQRLVGEFFMPLLNENDIIRVDKVNKLENLTTLIEYTLLKTGLNNVTTLTAFYNKYEHINNMAYIKTKYQDSQKRLERELNEVKKINMVINV